MVYQHFLFSTLIVSLTFNSLRSYECRSVILHRSASTLSLGLQSGVLFAVPIPEEQAAAGQQIEEAIQTAVTEARYKKSLWLVNKCDEIDC